MQIFEGSNPYEVINKIDRKDSENSIDIINTIQTTDNQNFYNIHNGLIRDIIADTGSFNPKNKGEIKRYYEELNSSVHAHIDESWLQKSLQQRGNPFESPAHSEDELQSFLEQYRAGLDIEGVLILNEFEPDTRRNEEIKNLLADSDYLLPGLTDTKSKLDDLRQLG